jgi:hypothetical protein
MRNAVVCLKKSVLIDKDSTGDHKRIFDEIKNSFKGHRFVSTEQTNDDEKKELSSRIKESVKSDINSLLRDIEPLKDVSGTYSIPFKEAEIEIEHLSDHSPNRFILSFYTWEYTILDAVGNKLLLVKGDMARHFLDEESEAEKHFLHYSFFLDLKDDISFFAYKPLLII